MNAFAYVLVSENMYLCKTIPHKGIVLWTNHLCAAKFFSSKQKISCLKYLEQIGWVLGVDFVISKVTVEGLKWEKKLKKKSGFVFLEMFYHHNDLTDYIEGMLYALEYSKIITTPTYDRYDALLDKFRYTKKMISFRGA